MGKYAQRDRSRALSSSADREVDADHRTPRGDDACLSEPASGALGSTLNQSSQVQRLASLGRSMNSGPNAGGLAQLRESLNPAPSPTGVVQRAGDLDLSDDAWLDTWYGKTPGEKTKASEKKAKDAGGKVKPSDPKSMTAERKYTQMLNNILQANEPEGRSFDDRVNSISWDDMKGDLLSTMISFHTHVAPYVPAEGHGHDRGAKGTGGKYYRGNAHRYKDIYKGIAEQIPSIKEDLAKPPDPAKRPKPKPPKPGKKPKPQKEYKREVVEPFNKPLVEMLMPLAQHSADITRLTESKATGAYVFDPTSTYRQFGSLAVAQNNFVVLEKAQKLFDSYNEDMENPTPMPISKLLLGDYGVERGYKGTGRRLRQGTEPIAAQSILPQIAKSLEGLSQPATNEPFHDFMLRDRGETVDRLGEMVNSSVFDKYQAVGAEKHPSLVLHKIGEAKTPKQQTSAARKWEAEFMKSFQESGKDDPWAEPAIKRSSFGFVRPTVSRVGESIRLWPGYAPQELLAAGIKRAVGIVDTDTELSPDKDKQEPTLHVEALKAAVRHALIVLRRGDANELDGNRAVLRDWLQTRLAINLRKAQYLLALGRDGSAISTESKDEMLDTTTSGVAPKSVESRQHYMKSAEVIERLQEYAFQYSALTFKRKDASVEPTEAAEVDPYEQYLGTAAFVKGRQHKTFYLDSGMQGLNIANLLVKDVLKDTAKSQGVSNNLEINVKMHHPYFENESARTSLRLNKLADSDVPKKGDIISADLSPVLISKLQENKRLTSKQYKQEIGTSLASGAIPILDVTNASLKSVNDLIAEKSVSSPTENFIIAESLVKHSQLGTDKYSMGRLVVVGDETFIKKAETFLKPFTEAASHPLLQEFRRNMDEVLYGDTVIDLSATWKTDFAERAKSYNTFMDAMGFKIPWAEASGQEWPEDPDAMDTSKGKEPVGEADPTAGWELLHRAFNDYVGRIVETTKESTSTLKVAFKSLPSADQKELQRRIAQILLPEDIKANAAFASFKTGQATETGIENVGNSCYLAAGLNMLAFSNYFDFFCPDNADSIEIEENIIGMEDDRADLRKLIGGILRDIRGGAPIPGERITELLQVLNRRGLLPPPSAFDVSRGRAATEVQQDPNEVFFTNILADFGDDLREFKLGQAVRTQVYNRGANPSIEGTLNDRSVPDENDSYLSNIENGPTIELEIAGAGTLRNAMARLLQTEADDDVRYVEEDRAVLYQGTGARTRLLDDQTPRALTISLKRWRADLSKDESKLDMPQKFVLNGAVYRLDTVVYHRGRQPSSGHYTTSTRSRDSGAWQYRNDESVADDPDFAQRSPHGYMFTYSRDDAAIDNLDALLDIRKPGDYVPPPVIPANANEGRKFGREGTSSGDSKENTKKGSRKTTTTATKRKRMPKADNKKAKKKQTENQPKEKTKGSREKKRQKKNT